jgi:hypothetical protein
MRKASLLLRFLQVKNKRIPELLQMQKLSNVHEMKYSKWQCSGFFIAIGAGERELVYGYFLAGVFDSNNPIIRDPESNGNKEFHYRYDIEQIAEAYH